MNLRQEDLQSIAKTAGFRAEMLEKVIRLIELLNELFDNTFLKQRLALKGGTVLNQNDLQQTSFAERLVTECQEILAHLLPFTENEKIFFDRLLNEGEIESSLITSDTEMQKKINLHPGLLWKAQNVKKFNENKQKE
jgi:hypothetical protein